MTRYTISFVTFVALFAACERATSTSNAPEPLTARRGDAVFVNGDFEDGGLTGWTITTHMNYGIIVPPGSRADLKLLDGGVNKTKIITGATETLVPSGLTAAQSLRVPKYGQNAAVVNEAGNNHNANTLSQTFTTTAADVDPSDNKIHVRFALAPVLYSGGHGAADQPYFWASLTNITKGTTLFTTFNFANQAGVPWQIYNSIYFTDWQSFDISPGNVQLAVGDTVKLEVVAAGCSATAHFGEVYVDGFGAFLPGLSVSASAPTSANAGNNITYTLNYQNRGTGASNGTAVTFNLPANVLFQSISAPGATCTTPALNASTGAVVCDVGTVSPSASGAFTVTVQIAPAATGKISAGNYSIRATGVSPLLGPLVETSITTGIVYADLSAVITDGVAAVGWGQSYPFSLTFANTGASTATAAPVTWAMPAQLASATWTCAGTGGGTCATASGSGSIASTVTLPTGSSVTYTIAATLVAGTGTGSMSNLATISAPSGVQDDDASDNSAIDTDAIGTLRTLTVTKAGTGTGRLVSSPAAIDCAAGCSSASTSYIDGTVVSITATATSGHSFTGFSGACTGTTNPCSFTVSGDMTLSATFAMPSFNITASAGSGGSISPSGTVAVGQGTGQVFTVTPSAGQHVADVLVDGASVGAVATYTFSNVTAAHTIAASFAIDTFTLTASAGSGGSISSPGATSINYGSSKTYTVTATSGQHVADVLVDGASVGAVTTYTFSNVTASHTIAASFALDAFAITASAGSGGSITPAGVTSVSAAGSQTYTMTPATGMHVADVVVDGVSVGALPSYTFFVVLAPHTIAVSFAIDTFSLAASAGGGGSISPSGLVSANYGASQAFSFTPSTGMHVASVVVDGASVGAGSTYTFSNITASHTIAVSFAIDTFSITASAGSGGSISPAGATSVDYAGSQSYVIAPATGRHIAEVLVDGVSAGAIASYAFSNVTAAHTIAASFALDTFAITGSTDPTGSVSCTSPVSYGSAATCTATPAPGYELVGLTDDGANAGSVSPYVISNVTAAHSVVGTFKKSRGGACSASNECGTGVCVDGVCCDTACGGQCEACAVPGSVGTCVAVSGAPAGSRAACAGTGTTCGGTCDGTERAACTYPQASTSCRDASCAAGVETHAASCDGAGACPSAVTAACNPYICGATACAATCAVDAQCADGYFCAAGGTCEPKQTIAAACTRDSQCGSGSCVDGVCCNAACDGQCEACDVTGHVGECTAVSGAPHAARTACDSDGSQCGGSCDGSARTACHYPAAETSCRGASCAAGTATLGAACDGQGRCPAVQTETCPPYVCGADACVGNCQADSDCSAGNWCSGGVCEPKKLPSATCGADNQCGSGHCTDGVCCNVACDGQCEACDVTGSAGACVAVSGAPHDGRPECATDGSQCGGQCDGSSRTACAYPAASVQCRAASCATGVATLAAACDGHGACPAEQLQACAPFVCGAAACLGDCLADSDCQAGNWCSAGVCVDKRNRGGSCGADNQCDSGFCTDGVCCNRACDGQCEACDVALSQGTCAPVAGAPHGAREACDTDGTSCGGQCDGAQATACAYPDSQCRAAGCAAGVATMAAACAHGHCPAMVQQGCGQFACGVSACHGDCESNGDCAAGSWCAAGVCQTKKVISTACTGNDQCGSGACVDGVCCNVACDGQCEACDVAGSVGTCAPSVGAPHGGRAACASDDSVCGGACDGSQRDACVYPAAAVQCSAAACSGGVEVHAASCNGAGVCAQAETRMCGTFACGATACSTGCQSDAECSADGLCIAGACRPRGDGALWQVQGGPGLGCSSSGGGAFSLFLAVAVLWLMRARRKVAGVAVALVCATAGVANAQSADVSRSFLLERFNPQSGGGDVLGVQSAQAMKHLSFNALVYFSYADVPLRAVTVDDNGVRNTLAANQETVTAAASLGLFGRFEVGAALPVTVTQSVGASAVDPGLAAGGNRATLSDLRLSVKARLYEVGPFSFAVSLPVTLPTSGQAAYSGYVGPTASPTAMAQWRGPRRSAVLVNAGVALRQPQQLLNLTVGSAFTYGVGGKVDLVPRFNLALLGNVGGEIGFASGAKAVQSPLEALVAVRWMPVRGVALTLGAGPGLSPGYGTPRYRVIASLGWVPSDDDEVEAPVKAEAPTPLPEQKQSEPMVTVAPPEPAPVPVPEEDFAPMPAAEPEVAAPPAPRVIRTMEKVFFATGRAEAQRSSLAVLDEVVRVMKEDATIRKVRVEAHTDASAPAAYNEKLSKARAAWVREYLMKQGIAGDRLDAEGYGLEKPIAPNETPEGRTANRRVEFVIVE